MVGSLRSAVLDRGYSPSRGADFGYAGEYHPQRCRLARHQHDGDGTVIWQPHDFGPIGTDYGDRVLGEWTSLRRLRGRRWRWLCWRAVERLGQCRVDLGGDCNRGRVVRNGYWGALERCSSVG